MTEQRMVIVMHEHRVVDGGEPGSIYSHDHSESDTHEDASTPHEHNAHGLDEYVGSLASVRQPPGSVVDEVRESHKPGRLEHGPERTRFCVACVKAMPCPTLRLADRVEELEEALHQIAEGREYWLTKASPTARRALSDEEIGAS